MELVTPRPSKACSSRGSNVPMQGSWRLRSFDPTNRQNPRNCLELTETERIEVELLATKTRARYAYRSVVLGVPLEREEPQAPAGLLLS
jgi:hypothetical protein